MARNLYKARLTKNCITTNLISFEYKNKKVKQQIQSLIGRPVSYRIVILESDHARRNYYKSIITKLEHIPFCFEKVSICLDNLISLKPDLILFGFPKEELAFRFLNAIELIETLCPVFVISNNSSIQHFIEMNRFNKMVKMKPDFAPSDIDQTIQSARNYHANHISVTRCPVYVGNTPKIRQIIKMVPNLSQTKERILIVGEEGSGRKLLARAIHFRSKAEVGAFHTIKPNMFHNWGTVLKKFSSNEKATVNSHSSNDYLEKLNSDTLFLSDIDKIPASSHSALFRLLQFSQNSDHKLVGNSTFPKRIIASASTNLSNLLDAGIFRKDLYFRLNEIQISIPPLRERVDDIPLLADFFSDRFTIETNKSFYNLSDETKKILCNYTWPGNVKELSVLIKKIILHGNESKLLDNLKSLTKKRPYTFLNDTVGDIYSLAELSDIKNYMKDLNNLSLKSICQVYMGRTEKKLLKKALHRTNGNRKKAALMLDISYKSFLNKIKAYNLQKL